AASRCRCSSSCCPGTRCTSSRRPPCACSWLPPRRPRPRPRRLARRPQGGRRRRPRGPPTPGLLSLVAPSHLSSGCPPPRAAAPRPGPQGKGRAGLGGRDRALGTVRFALDTFLGPAGCDRLLGGHGPCGRIGAVTTSFAEPASSPLLH